MRVLFVPAVGRGGGTGHLRRCAELARRLGPEAAVLLSATLSGLGVEPQELLRSLGFGEGSVRFVEGVEGAADWELIVLDRRATSIRELKALGLDDAFGPRVAAFDEGGQLRWRVPYLVDLLPTAPGLPAPNRACPGLLLAAAGWDGTTAGPAGPPAVPSAEAPSADAAAAPRRILLTFGGEDRADLSARMIDALIRRLGLSPERVSVVEGPLFERREWPEGVTILRRPERLKELFRAFGLVITSYGLTTYEALAAGVPVVHFNPTRYHRKLSRAAGIPEVGVRRPRLLALRRLLVSSRAAVATLPIPRRSLEPPADLARFFRSLRSDAPAACPVCGSPGGRAEARFENRSYLRCGRCGITYLLGFDLAPRPYEADYFGEEYRRQYGRTYLEDFEAIREAGLRRLGVVTRLLGAGSRASQGRPRLLDVGCAYGPFLAAARDLGFDCQGMDVSAAAVAHVRDGLGLPCVHGSFESDAADFWPAGSFDVISLWYVIEHFLDPAAVLHRAARLLRPGGVLAFSTPNGSGVSARCDRTAFLRAGPEDHRTVWDPRTARRVVRRFGFRPKAFVVTGHHPERFPRVFRTRVLRARGFETRVVGTRQRGGVEEARPGSFRYGLLLAASRALRLGDTFELYCVREWRSR